MSYAPWTCEMCNGHGMIGGLLPGDGGYDGESCPDCDKAAFTYKVVLRSYRSGIPTEAVRQSHDTRLREPYDVHLDAYEPEPIAHATQAQALEAFKASRYIKLRWSHAIFMQRSDGLRRWVHRDEYRSKDEA